MRNASKRARKALRSSAAAAFMMGLALSVISCASAGSVFGNTSSCDRRNGTSPDPDNYCQELQGSVAGTNFRDDCTQKLQGTAAETRCSRSHMIGGCRSREPHKDGSTVTDWFYNVDDLVARGIPFTQPEQIHTKREVLLLCDDSLRYDQGADYIDP